MARVAFVYFDVHTGFYPALHHGLAHIIGALKSENHEVSLAHILDERDCSQVVRSLNNEDPDLVCLSFTSNQIKYVRSFLNVAEYSPRVTVAGGVHCTLAQDEVLAQLGCPHY